MYMGASQSAFGSHFGGGLASTRPSIGPRGYSYRFVKSVARITGTAEVFSNAYAVEMDGLYHAAGRVARGAEAIRAREEPGATQGWKMSSDSRGFPLLPPTMSFSRDGLPTPEGRREEGVVSRICILFGLLLILLGVGAFLYALPSAEKPPFTALIPAFFGAALVFLGALAMKERLRMHAMHLAALLGLIGVVVPGVMAVPKLPTLLSEGKVLRADGTDASVAIMVQSAMAVLCLIFLGLCINSFIQARRSRTQGA